MISTPISAMTVRLRREMNEIHRAFYAVGEAIEWPLYETGMCLREALVDVAISEALELNKAAKSNILTGEVHLGLFGNYFAVSIYLEKSE